MKVYSVVVWGKDPNNSTEYILEAISKVQAKELAINEHKRQHPRLSQLDARVEELKD